MLQARPQGLGSQCEVALLMQVQSLEDTLQNVNLQMSRIKSDLRVTQQEKEALQQEVISLHKQLQNAGDKVIFFFYGGITLYRKVYTF